MEPLTLTQKYMIFWLQAQPKRFEIEHSYVQKVVLYALFKEMLDNGSLIIDAKDHVIAMDVDRTKTSYQKTLFVKASEHRRTWAQWMAYYHRPWHKKQYHLLVRGVMLSLVERNQMGMYTVLHFAKRRIYFEPYDYQIKDLLQDMKQELRGEAGKESVLLLQLMKESGIASFYFTTQELNQFSQHEDCHVCSCLCLG